MATFFRSSRRHPAFALAVLPAFVLLAGCHRDPNVRKQKYLESGKRFEAQGKYKEALIQFANAIKIDQNFAAAHYETAETYLHMDSIIPAYSELLRAVDQAPSDQHARLELGNIQLGGGLPEKAEEQARAVLALNSNNADAYALLSAVNASRNNRAEALADIQHAIALDPGKAAFHTSLGLLQGSDASQGSQAEAELHQAIALDPKAAESHLVLAALLEKRGDLGGAATEATSAVKSNPKDLRARLSLAELYFRQGNKQQGEEALRQAADELPENKAVTERLADYYVRSNQLDAGESAFSALVAKHPDSVALKLGYARVLIFRQSFDKLRALVQDLNKKNAGDPDVQGLSATLLVKDGKINEAFDLMQKASKESPENVGAQMAFANIAMIKGDINAAQGGFRNVIMLAPDNLQAKRGLAQIASTRGDYSLLAQLANDVIAKYPDFSDAYIWRGAAEGNQGQLEKAEADFELALKKNPNNAAAMLSMAQMRFRQQRSAEGVSFAEKALSIDPSLLEALNLLVNYDLVSKQPAKALTLVQQAIARAPQNAVLYGTLSRVQFSMGSFPAARDSAQTAMRLDPSNRNYVQQYAESELASGDKSGPIAAWQKWTQDHPKDNMALALLGAAQELNGDPHTAMQTYKKALDLDAHNVMAANNLAYLMVEDGQSADLALSYAQIARQALPTSPSTADTLAWVYYHQGIYASARGLLEDALKQDPNSPTVNYHLGMVYLKTGNSADAEARLKKAASLAPNTKTGKDAEAALAQFGKS